jgi:hypothetical protein
MSEFDESAFRQKVSELFDDELIALLSINASSYSPDALAIAASEAENRGIAKDVQKVSFDVFLNSMGFAGRLILLEEQLMFLSTGMPASSGTAGLIARETHLSARNVAASRLDFSALDTEGSWIYFLDQIEDCKSASKFLSGNELQFVIREEDGTVLNGVVNCGDISKQETQDLAAAILSARVYFISRTESKPK